MAKARREAIASEGAEVVVVEGTYDDAVERSAEERGLLISEHPGPATSAYPRG
jgi:diaminopropionate ammonia-lyase